MYRKGDILKESIYWVDGDGEQGYQKGSRSPRNRKEAAAICNYIEKLAETVTVLTEVAVITPYAAQKACISSMLKKLGRDDNGCRKAGCLSIRVDTVDSFQGSEADLVLYSPVRSKPPISFILDKKRLNVACSRARRHLLFFGNSEFLRHARCPRGQVNFFAHIIEKSSFDEPAVVG